MVAVIVDELSLIMGNRNYSSWSLRPWILMKHLGLAFSERVLPLDTPQFARDIVALSPTRRVPILRHGDLLIWDSFAICEYASELAHRGWPRDRAARAVARSACAEMHSGFGALRSQWPMNARARHRKTTDDETRGGEIARIQQLWAECRSRFGASGPWLFGEYSVADAMYAPVVLRFRTYGPQLGEVAASYVATTLADPHMREWIDAASAEPWTIEASEIGRPDRVN
jgi:glutathione S-transferase